MAKTRVSTGQIAGNLKFEGSTGIVVPKGSTADRNSSPESGEIRYNTDLAIMEIYNGTAWGTMGPFPFAFTEYFIGDGTSYEFILSKSVSDQDDIIVTLNGSQLRAGLDFRIIDGNILSFTEDDSTQNPPLDGSEINVRGYSPITSASIPAGSITLNELAFSDGTSGQVLTTNGAGTISFQTIPTQDPTVGGDIEGTASNAQIKANTISVRELAVSDGSIGQVLATDGSGNLSFITVTGGGGSGGGATNFFDLTGQIAYAQIPNNLINIAKLDVTDGTTGQVLSTNGSGVLSFITVPTELANDSSPQLGGNLDLNSNNVTGTGNINITGSVTATSFVGDGSGLTNVSTVASIDDLTDVDTTTSAPTSGQFLKWNGSNWVPDTVAGVSPQNLWLTINSDSGSTSANSTTDALTIQGGTDISTSISGDVLTINYTGAGAGTQDLFATILSDSGSTTANSAIDTLTVSGGTGISTSIVGDTLTITNSSPNVDQNLFATVSSDSGSTTANTTTDTLTVSGGTGISTAIVGDTLTITNTVASVNTFGTVAVAGQTDVTADSSGDTLTLVAGSNITLTTSGNSVTINASAGAGGTGTVTTGTAGRLAYYATTGTTVVETNSTLAWNAGTDTLTVDNLEVTTAIGDIATGNITTTGNITASGTVTANTVDADIFQSLSTGTPTFTSGNDIVFDATGDIRFSNNKLRELQDPSVATDAATKRYVDENTFTKFEIGADDSTLRTVLPGESIKIIGGTNVTTSSDAEGNITINATATGDPDQNLFATIQSDSGSTTANTTTDTLTVSGGTDISTSISGDTLTINYTGSGGGATVISDLTDVNTSGVAAGDMLYYNGSTWIPTSGPVTQWTIGANGSSDYTFSGPGFPSGTENDPDLVLYRGHTYRFNNTTGASHPFLIKTTPGTGTGNQFTDGVSGSSTGVVIFEVPMTPSTTTLYYQCEFHAGMVGNITIV